MGNLLECFLQNWLEIIASITGFLYIYFSIRQNILLWLFGIITSFLYLFVFFQAKFYADMSLQVYYVVISVYGWYYWGKDRQGTENRLGIATLDLRVLSILVVISSILFYAISYLLVNYTDSPLPYWDSFTTSISIVATWMLARKYIEQWILWMIVNFVSIGLYLYKDLFFTVFLFVAYFILAIIGYFQWKKELS